MHVEPFSQVELHKVRFNTLFDIVPIYFDVLIAIRSRLRVEKSKSVKELVDDASVSSNARADGNLLLSSFATDETPAAVS